MNEAIDRTGDIVLITGAAGALGEAVVDAFSETGATVVGMDIEEPDTWEGTGEFYTADLTDDAIAEETFNSVITDTGPLDSLVTLAGTWKGGSPIEETTVETFNSVFDINLKTMFLAAKYALPSLKEQGGGSIVTVSARSGLEGGSGDGPYRASKAGVRILTETIAAEQSGIVRANTIMPSIIDTAMNREMMPDADHDSWVDPRDIADVIVWLSGDGASVTSGAAIPVYGEA